MRGLRTGHISNFTSAIPGRRRYILGAGLPLHILRIPAALPRVPRSQSFVQSCSFPSLPGRKYAHACLREAEAEESRDESATPRHRSRSGLLGPCPVPITFAYRFTSAKSYCTAAEIRIRSQGQLFFDRPGLRLALDTENKH